MTPSSDHSPLLNLLWRSGHLSGRDFTAVTGETITIVAQGEQWRGGVWYAAEIVVDCGGGRRERRRGVVVIGERTPVPDGAVLRVVEGYAPGVLGIDDRLVPQIEYAIEPSLVKCYDDLRRGAALRECAPRIASMETLHRLTMGTGLVVERLRRKTERIAAIFEESGQDWNQTFHTLLLTAMGGDRNRDAFAKLSSRVASTTLSREKSSIQRVEALLLGGAGFLHAIPDRDDYTLRLEEEFRHMAAKYSIVPMKPAEWNLAKLYPANHPAVRLAEIAALVCKKDFMLDGVLRCCTSKDVEALFAVTASDYWITHYKPSGEISTPSPKSIGRAKARLVGINLAAPLMFAYGKETGAEELCERALDLLIDIPAEHNGKLEEWYRRGCRPENSFGSQALLELSDEYCGAGACAECATGRAEIKKIL